ncbi:MAG: NAD(P)H-binding protein [Acidobacteriota bacterium]|nr:NAD(P)H-binding protein [Acidobacteriota bacterium]
MHDQLFVVTGATGNIGRRLAELLLEGHRRVRVVGRDEERLRPLAAAGAQVLHGSLDDPDFARRAFAGAHAAFTMVPPNLSVPDLRHWQNRVSDAIAGGLRAAAVPYVVNLSSIGAEVPYGTGPIAGLHDQEERLDSLEGTNVVHLRPASFMENHLQSIGLIRSQGAYLGVLPGDVPSPTIATRDIADEAARLLAALDFEDKSTRELLGARDYTMTEAVHILGSAIGKPHLSYVVISEDQARHGMLAAGLPPPATESLLEMYRAMVSGKIRPSEPRLRENTTNTTLEDWATSDFALAWHAAGG